MLSGEGKHERYPDRGRDRHRGDRTDLLRAAEAE